MDARSQIPVIALLGLCLTECGKEEPTIVGTWTAIEIDMEKFPMVESGMGYMARYGVEMRVEDDLSGDFGYYMVYSEDGIGVRNEYGFPLTVDDDDAPRYAITLSYVPGDDVAYNDTAPPGDAIDTDERLVGPLRSRVTPRAADMVVLSCELDGDRLECTSASDGGPQALTFARKLENK